MGTQVLFRLEVLLHFFCTLRGVLAKLLIFSFSLAVVPLSSYFLSEKYIWNGTLPLNSALKVTETIHFVLIQVTQLSLLLPPL